MAERLPGVDVRNDDGSCWTCIANVEPCDAQLPWCSRCIRENRECAGYHARMAWPVQTKTKQNQRTSSRSRLIPLPSPTSFSSHGLPAVENLLLQHYIKNISRIAIAVDHAENGFRRLSVSALNDLGLLNAILALSASHMSRWQKKQDTTSSIYLRRSLQNLQGRFARPASARNEITLSTMMVLVIYEAFSGGDRWKYHYCGVTSWLRARGSHADISPFLLSWVCMSATQTALHWGTTASGSFPTTLFESTPSPTRSGNCVDPLYGCSVELPKLMIEAAQLREFVRQAREFDRDSEHEIHARAAALQERILATKMQLDTTTLSMTMQAGVALTVSDLASETETLKTALHASEVFRHALHIFVFRIVQPPISPMTKEIKASLNAVFELLPLIPDTLGPGSMLGWALVVVGAEVDELEDREYIKMRCDCITLLQLNSGISAQHVLDEVWRRRDMIKSGKSNGMACDWQEVLQELGINEVLF